MSRLTDANGICVDCKAVRFCKTNCAEKQRYDKLKYYEDLEKQERLLIQAFAIDSTAECPNCGYSETVISETWIRPELLQHDRFYATRSEAEQALKKMEEMK